MLEIKSPLSEKLSLPYSSFYPISGSRRRLRMVYFALIFQSLISSGTHLVAKVVVKDIEPVGLTMIRSTLAAVGLLLVMLIRRTPGSIAREDYGRILLLSFLAIPANQFLFLTALRHTTAANAALMYAATPAVVLVISSVTGREHLTLKKMLGVSI